MSDLVERLREMMIRGPYATTADRDALLTEVRELVRERRAACDLLAVIHCDGGHRTEQVGFTQSCKDAIAVRQVILTAHDDACEREAKVREERDTAIRERDEARRLLKELYSGSARRAGHMSMSHGLAEEIRAALGEEEG